MKLRTTSVAEILAPLKSMAQRSAYSALMLLSVAIIVLGKADVTLIGRVRTATADAMAPILSVLSQPVSAAASGVDRLSAMVEVYRENERLKGENAMLLQWQQVARRLEGENQALRDLTHYAPEGAVSFVTARVIGTEGGAYSRNLLIDRGSTESVAKGQAAVSGSGLVGRIAEVGDRAARVLLVTDINSRIPITLQSTGDRAILAGDNSDRPVIDYLPQNAKVRVGDRVVTSGDGGVFPPGLAVGVVSAIEGGRARVEPATDLARIEYVRLVDFGLGGALPAAVAAKPARKGDREASQKP